MLSLFIFWYYFQLMRYWFGLVWFGLVLWNIKHCCLFNAKSIFIHINILFQTMQFNVSTQFKCQTIQLNISKVFFNSWNIHTVVFLLISATSFLLFVCFHTVSSVIGRCNGSFFAVLMQTSSFYIDAFTKEVLHILQSSSITRASSSDCLEWYPRHSFGEFTTCKEKVGVFCSSTPNQIN